jgi:hypothetical protein
MPTSITSTGVTFPDATTQTTAASSAFTTGTLMLFQQTAAPTGWTKQTTHNDKALRVVSGTASSGGSVAFTTAFASQGVSISGSTGNTAAGGTVGNTTLSTSTIPSHSHTNGGGGSAPGNSGNGLGNNLMSSPGNNTGNAGGGGAHAHPFTGSNHLHSFSGSTSVNLAVQYVDLIIASKD